MGTSETLTISERGLRLIKAFEGFRPVDRELITGARVVGYGHRVSGRDAVIMSRDDAHATLLEDLSPFEDMVNESVYAVLTQDQFDALVSLAFNIGPKAFLGSDVLRAVNAGRPLEAARAFDAWRLADINGETFAVDALVRRRTAERALFLRPPDGALAPRAPSSDLRVRRGAIAVEADTPIIDRDGNGRYVSDVPIAVERLITDLPTRRVEDGPAGELAEAELPEDAVFEAPDRSRPTTLFADLDTVIVAPDQAEDVETDILDTIAAEDDSTAEDDADPRVAEPDAVTPPARSLIADAADEVRERLQALMDAPEADGETDDTPLDDTPLDDARADWPESLITAAGLDDEAFLLDETLREPDAPEIAVVRKDTAEIAPTRTADVVRFPGVVPAMPTPDAVAEDARSRAVIVDPDVAEEPADGPALFVTPQNARRGDAPWPFLIIASIGAALFGAGAMLRLREVAEVWGLPGDLVGLGMAMVGGMILLGGLMYLVRSLLD